VGQKQISGPLATLSGQRKQQCLIGSPDSWGNVR